MNNFLLRKATQAEKGVINFLNQLSDAKNLSLQVISEKSHASISTVSRVIRKIGFANIFELKYYLNHRDSEKVNKNNFVRALYQPVIDYYDYLDLALIVQIANCILQNEYVICYAQGRSQILAQELAWDLSSIKIKSTHNTLHQNLNVFLDSSTVIVAICLDKNESNEIRKFIKVAAYRGATIVALTNNASYNWIQNVHFLVNIPQKHVFTKIEKYLNIDTRALARMINLVILEQIIMQIKYKV